MRGVVPIVPTTFAEGSELDPDSQRRAVDFLIDALMAEGGIVAAEAPRLPLRPLSTDVRAGLVAMARRLDLLVLRWSR